MVFRCPCSLVRGRGARATSDSSPASALRGFLGEALNYVVKWIMADN